MTNRITPYFMFYNHLFMHTQQKSVTSFLENAEMGEEQYREQVITFFDLDVFT